MKKITLKYASRYFLSLLSFTLIGYILFHNIAPFGVTRIYTTENSNSSLKLNPASRISQQTGSDGQPIYTILNDIVYFTSDFPFAFDEAILKITYKNPGENQSFFAGYQDQEIWHYDTHLINMPIIDKLISSGWTQTNGVPNLIQREKKYDTFDEFLSNPPNSDSVGSYNFNANIFRNNYIPDYTPSESDSIIDTPLRGRVVFYVYLNEEPFKLSISKQDLNTHSDPSVVTVRIYKENDVVYSTQFDDDGIIDGSGKVLPAQETFIQNPGPELPEPGVYKVIIDGNSDTVITKMVTNLHKIVFDSPLYPVSNHEVYPNISDKTQQTNLITDATRLDLLTYHPLANQNILIGTQSAELVAQQQITATPSATTTHISLPKSDVVIRGKSGYFAFLDSQVFQPTRFHLQTIGSPDDINNLNFIIADYKIPSAQTDWKISETTFNVQNAFVRNGKLNWLIRSPGLKDNNNKIIIKKIELLFSKKPKIKI